MVPNVFYFCPKEFEIGRLQAGNFGNTPYDIFNKDIQFVMTPSANKIHVGLGINMISAFKNGWQIRLKNSIFPSEYFNSIETINIFGDILFQFNNSLKYLSLYTIKANSDNGLSYYDIDADSISLVNDKYIVEFTDRSSIFSWIPPKD